MLELLPTYLFDPSQYHPDIFLLRGVWIAEQIVIHHTRIWGDIKGLCYTLVDDYSVPILNTHGQPYVFDTPTEALAALPVGFVAHEGEEQP